MRVHRVSASSSDRGSISSCDVETGILPPSDGPEEHQRADRVPAVAALLALGQTAPSIRICRATPPWGDEAGPRGCNDQREDVMATPKHVLIVEDEYLIRALLQGMIQELGYILTASVGTLKDAQDLSLIHI